MWEAELSKKENVEESCKTVIHEAGIKALPLRFWHFLSNPTFYNVGDYITIIITIMGFRSKYLCVVADAGTWTECFLNMGVTVNKMRDNL